VKDNILSCLVLCTVDLSDCTLEMYIETALKELIPNQVDLLSVFLLLETLFKANNTKWKYWLLESPVEPT
jgi:hypothetical protein